MGDSDSTFKPEPSLHELQHDFLHYLQNGERTIERAVHTTEKVSAELRLNIYANAYWSRLSEALQENFPALHTLLGDDDFYALAEAYTRHYPSTSFSLRYCGDQLAGFLQQQSPYAEQPLLAEMAQFEWAVWAAFDAPDVLAATLADIQAVPPEQWGDLVFNLHPSAQLLNLQWNVAELWQAITDEAEPIDAEQHAYPQGWLVWRQELATYFRVLEVDEARALASLQRGESFAFLCEGICEWVDAEHAAARVVGFLQVWLNDGVVCLQH